MCIQSWVHWLKFGWQFKEFQGRVADDRLDIFRGGAGEVTKSWALDAICRYLYPGNDVPYLSLSAPCVHVQKRIWEREGMKGLLNTSNAIEI